MANYKLFNGVGAKVKWPTGTVAQVELVFDLARARYPASIDLAPTPPLDLAKATIDAPGVYDDGAAIVTTSNHYLESAAFPVTTVVPKTTAADGALYLDLAEFSRHRTAAGGGDAWPNGYGYSARCVEQFQSMVYEDNGRQRRYHGFHATVVDAKGTICTLAVESFYNSPTSILTATAETLVVDLADPAQVAPVLRGFPATAGASGAIFLGLAFCAKTKTASGAILRGPKLPPQG